MAFKKTQACNRHNLRQKILSDSGPVGSAAVVRAPNRHVYVLKWGVCLLMGGWGGEFYPNPFLLIRVLDSRRTLANGCRRPPGRGDILGAAPGPPILWPVRRAGWGLGPDPLGPPSGPSRITQTCSHPCCRRCTLSFFIVVVLSARVIGVEQRCFNLTAAQI